MAARRQNPLFSLSLGVATAALLASASAVVAEDFTWAGLPGTKDVNEWDDATRWLSHGVTAVRAPTAGDTATISSGNGSMGTEMAIDTLNHSGGNTAIGHYGVVNVSTFNLSGGTYKQSAGGLAPIFLNGPPGITNVSRLLNITGGTLSGQGEVNIASGGTVSQSGGTVAGTVSITTPIYQQSGGAMKGTVNLDTLYTLSGNGSLEGSVHGDGSAAMIQSGGTMSGSVDGIAAYTQSGGTMGGNVATGIYSVSGGSLAGRVDFTELFALSGDDTTVEWMDLVGTRDAVMTQSGGTMDGHVYNESSDHSTGIATYSQSGGTMGGVVVADAYELSGGSVGGSVEFADLFALSGNGVAQGELRGDGDATITQSGGSMEAEITGAANYIQSGGTMNSTLAVDKYTQSGGTIVGTVNTNTYELAGGTGDGFQNVAIANTLLQSGGTLNRNVTVPIFTHSGGAFSGTVSAQTYNLTGAHATSTGGSITASDLFNLAPTSGTAIVDGQLSGGGNLVKSGASRVVLTNGTNDFTGAVSVNAGVLEVVDHALPDAAAVSIAADAALQLTTNVDTLFTGAMTGVEGDLIKAGAATATLSGAIDLGDLWLDAGRLNIGTGTSTNEASFETAVIARDAMLYIAKGATLTIRLPKHIINNGTLINDGTVHDDLDNNGTFANNQAYNANVASNTGLINNNTPGAWVGNVLTNAGTINNSVGSTWTGTVVSNSAAISNNGVWTGTVKSNGVQGVDSGLNFGKIIYNDYTAHWTGDIEKNYAWIFNQGGTWTGDVLSNNGQIWNDNRYGEIGIGYWIGDVVGNASMIFNGGGGDWHGNVLGNSRYGYIKNDAPAVWAGSVFGNDGIIENRGLWTGDIVGNSFVVINEKTWNGAVVAAGTVTSADTGNVPNRGNTGLLINANADAVWTGAVQDNSGTVDNRGGRWNGNVLANNGGIVNGAGTLNGVATGNSTWTGDVQTNAGSIENAAGSSWNGNVLSNAGAITSNGTWTGNFASAGTVNAQGIINGAFNNSGLLQVTGALSGITALTNTGTLDLRGGGAAQTLSVGTASFGTGSTIAVDVDGNGGSDRIVVAGNASLGGTLRVAAATGAHGSVGSYTALTAGSITGSFDDVSTDLVFLTPHLSYDATNAYVTVLRNNVGFASTGTSANQRSAGAAVEALGAGNAVYDALLWLTPAEAQDAFDQLSGEAYASAGSASIQSANMIQGVMQSRIDQAFGALGDSGDAVSGYAGDIPPLGDTQGNRSVWGQIYGATASSSADAAPLSAQTGGLVAGTDGMLADWRAGAMLQLGATSSSVPSLNSSVNSTDYGAGAYASTQWGATQLSLGGTYTLQDTKSARTVAFPGFSDTLTGNYLAGTAQAFAELSHEFDFGAVSLRPYAGLSHVRYASDGFIEAGGAASLSRAAQVIDATFATLGVGFDHGFVVGGDMLLTAKASLGWRHAFASDPDSVSSLASGPAFSVTGAPVATDLAVLSAGLALDVNSSTNLDLSYDGQLGQTTQTHALKATWAMQF
ncbi:autotransporter domain-containing protein [Devosia sp. UYZn731]|uniref:autotransporter domain-containing protein n=1 Tax=Devosia sp. UYZn731 TaxID=3156345 RepID=UPI0033988377